MVDTLDEEFRHTEIGRAKRATVLYCTALYCTVLYCTVQLVTDMVGAMFFVRGGSFFRLVLDVFFPPIVDSVNRVGVVVVVVAVVVVR